MRELRWNGWVMEDVRSLLISVSNRVEFAARMSRDARQSLGAIKASASNSVIEECREKLRLTIRNIDDAQDRLTKLKHALERVIEIFESVENKNIQAFNGIAAKAIATGFIPANKTPGFVTMPSNFRLTSSIDPEWLMAAASEDAAVEDKSPPFTFI